MGPSNINKHTILLLNMKYILVLHNIIFLHFGCGSFHASQYVRKLCYGVLLAFLFLPIFAAPQDEILVIEELIDTTKKNLDSQQKLHTMIVEFKQAREAFIANPDSGKLATKLVRQAMRLQNYLQKEHVSHLFSSDFLQELAFYNQVGKQVAHAQ